MFKTVTRKSWNNMKMGMEDDLSGCWVIVHFNINTVGTERAFYSARKFFSRFHNCTKLRVSHIEQIMRMFFWNNKRMAGVYRIDVEKGKCLIILIYFRGGYIFFNDLTKEAIIHGPDYMIKCAKVKNMKKYSLRDKITDKAKKELEEYTPFMQELLFHRDITKNEEARTFLNRDYARYCHDPFLIKAM